MGPATTTTRLLAFFVIAFLCLNAGAFFCLAYCEKGAAKAVESCPLKKAGMDHCPHSQTAKTNKDDAKFAGNSAACCMLPIGVFGVPLEAIGGQITSAPVAAVETANFASVVLAASRQMPKFYYRPPPNDARGSRVRNQVFRI